MMELLNKIKFEYVILALLFLSLMLGMVIFRGNTEIVDKIVTALIGLLGSITGYIFTKYNPSRNEN